MDQPIVLDDSDGPWVERNICAWRRLEPGDLKLPHTELAPENPHLEVWVLSVAIAKERYEEMKAQWAERGRILEADEKSWTTRYEPAGVIFAAGGGALIGNWLDYLSDSMLPFGISLLVLGVALGVFTRTRRQASVRRAQAAWKKAEVREQLEASETTLREAFDSLSERLREEHGFRTDVRVGDTDEAERLAAIDPDGFADPRNWAPDPDPHQVRYAAIYRNGLVIEREAELEDVEGGLKKSPDAKMASAEAEE